MTTDWTFTPPTAMPWDMLARRVTEVEQRWYAAEAELARTRAELAEARATLGRIVAATRPGRERGTYGAAVAHSQASWALRTQGPKPSAPPPEPPPRPDQDPSPWQPRAAMPKLDFIATNGTWRFRFDGRGLVADDTVDDTTIYCADGTHLSVVAGSAVRSIPSPGFDDITPKDYAGPYTHVEVGFPSVRPQPWAHWAVYADDPDAEPTDTVYNRVPVKLVRQFIEDHGGES